MKNNYMFSSIFTIEIDEISIAFPDFAGCLSSATTFEKAVKNATDVMALRLIMMKEKGDEIPDPTSSKYICLKSNQIIMLIQVDLPLYRATLSSR